MKNIQKFSKAVITILLISALVALLASSLTGEAKEKDTTLAELTKTLEIKAEELKTAKEDEQAKKTAYELAVKTREVKQEEKAKAMEAINAYINSGLVAPGNVEKAKTPEIPVEVSFQKSEK